MEGTVKDPYEIDIRDKLYLAPKYKAINEATLLKKDALKSVVKSVNFMNK